MHKKRKTTGEQYPMSTIIRGSKFKVRMVGRQNEICRNIGNVSNSQSQSLKMDTGGNELTPTCCEHSD